MTTFNGWEDMPTDGVIDIGNGTKITRVSYQDEWVGINEWHLHPTTGRLCGGWVPFARTKWSAEFKEDIATWEVESLEPLTISPSVLCTVCQHHGFVREGLWVPA